MTTGQLPDLVNPLTSRQTPRQLQSHLPAHPPPPPPRSLSGRSKFHLLSTVICYLGRSSWATNLASSRNFSTISAHGRNAWPRQTTLTIQAVFWLSNGPVENNRRSICSGSGTAGKLLLTTDGISSKEMIVYHQKDKSPSPTATGPWLPDATVVAIQILTARRNRDSAARNRELLDSNPINRRSSGSDLHVDPTCRERVLDLSCLETNETLREPENFNWVVEPTGSPGILWSEEGRSVGFNSRLLNGTRDLEESLQTLVHLLEASEQIVSSRRTESDRNQVRQPRSIEELVSLLLQKDDRLSLDRLPKHSHGDSRMLGARNFGDQKLLTLQSSDPKTFSLSPLHSNTADAASCKQAALYQLQAPERSSASLAAASYSNSSQKCDHKIKPPGSGSSQQERVRIPNVIAKLMGLEFTPSSLSVGTKVLKTPDAKGPVGQTKSREGITKLNSILLNSHNALLRIDFQTRLQHMDGSVTVENKAPERAPTARTTNQVEERYAKNVGPVQKKSDQPFNSIKQKNMQNINHNGGTMNTMQMSERENQRRRGDNSTTTIEPLQHNVQKPFSRRGIQWGLMQKGHNSDAQKAEPEDVETEMDLKCTTRTSKGKLLIFKDARNLVPDFRPHEKHFPMNVAAGNDAVHNTAGKNHGTVNQRKDMETLNKLHTAELVDYQLQDQKNLTKAKSDGRVRKKKYHEDPAESHATAINEFTKRHKAAKRPEKRGTIHKTDPKTSTKSVTSMSYPCFGGKPASFPPKMAAIKEPKLKEAQNPKKTQESSIAQKAKFCHEIPLEHSKISLAQELKQRRKERLREMANISKDIENVISEEHSQIFEVSSTSSGIIGTEEEISHNEIQPSRKSNLNNNADADGGAAASSLHDFPSKGDIPEAVQREGLASSTIGITKDASLLANSGHQQGTAFKPEKEGSLTEEENQLKHIFINSPTFLDAANAFFDIQMPTGILQASYLKIPKDHLNQLLDCAQEIMRRKSRREELRLRHSNKLAKYSKPLSLGELVKLLNEDLNSLKVCGDHGGFKPADYLHKLMERDIQSCLPHTSCLWDFDWFEGLFAEEKDSIAREMEKHILNELLNETIEQLYL